eukprot:CAMPEP_0168542958 /NCGR_PEP_ID=MMETSP0413-20121227/1627_1 /TAXON_ID=136452 /ORGANISM="Filamoeba nolandi, Strain NC-AS-23-1" /LENGTH=287 /DNA_ID=CAMNT_0008572873 /DNA_START=25 /DNA_END=888 /DNA_ORIENTATION=-
MEPKPVINTNTIVRGIVTDKTGNVYFLIYAKEGLLYRLYPQPELLFRTSKGMLTSLAYDETTNSLFMCTSFYQILKYSLNNDNNNSAISVVVGRDRPDINSIALSSIDDSKTPLPVHDGKFPDVLFWDLRGIAVDKNGDLWVVDKRHIRKISMKEQTVETICQAEATYHIVKSPNSDLIYCSRPFVAKGTGVWVVDTKLKQKEDKRVSPEGKIDNPRGLFLEADGTLLVAHESGICKVDPNAVKMEPFVELEQCRVITSDPQGNLYVGTNNCIMKIERAVVSSQSSS